MIIFLYLLGILKNFFFKNQLSLKANIFEKVIMSIKILKKT